jgi:protein O-GlcNAc transferase
MNVDEVVQRAMKAYSIGNLGQAELLFNQVLAADKRQFDALHMLGILQSRRRNYAEAVRLIDRAIEVAPQSAEAHADLGRIRFEMGDAPQAAENYLRALALDPDHAVALVGYSVILRNSGRPREALAHCDKALALAPENPDALRYRAAALVDLARHEEALAAYDKAVALAPGDAEAWLGRALACVALRRPDDARAAIEKAVALKPNSPQAWLALGNILSAQGSHYQALAAYDKSLALDPQTADAWRGRASVLTAQNRHPDAAAAYEKLLAIRPDAEQVPGLRLLARMQVCDWADWSGECERILAGVRQDSRVASPFVLLVVPATASDQDRCARAYAGAHHPAQSPPVWQGEKYRRDKINVAYISSDFRDHPASRLLAGLIERHDRERFATTAISFGRDDGSEMRTHLKSAFDRFVDVEGQSDLDAAKLLRELEIDIAVDLTGFAEVSRPGILAWRPAPIQARWLGHPGTTGADYIDYILADRFVVPAEQRPFYREHVVTLPDSWRADDQGEIALRTPTRHEAGLPLRGFVFCAFNQAIRITPDVFDVWMRLLSRVDDSVLWLSAGHAAASAHLRAEAERRGVYGERLVFAPRLPGNEDQNADQDANHLARHRLAGLFLDTLPCNALGAAGNALRAGLPVVTAMGQTFAGRVCGSMLHAAGLAELVTESLAEYEALALKLATEPALLRGFAAKLAAQRDACAWFDIDRFRRHMEAAYTTMRERHLRGEPPEDFAVSAIEA